MVPGERPEKVSVVAGGWSFGRVWDLPLPGLIIGVNESGLLIPRCDMLVSMDRLWTENRWIEGPPSHPTRSIRHLKLLTWIRRSATKNLHLGHWPWLRIFECDHEFKAGFADVPEVLNGSSSGLCALNLAYQLRPETVYLFGFDLQRGPQSQSYWYPPYTWRPEGGTSRRRYDEWSVDFARASKQFKREGIKVFNCSNRSRLTCFEKLDPREALEAA